MNDESELLRRYADERAEAAIAEIVRRHIGLVYHAALRQTGDASLAEDVTQTVFTDLARKAGALARRASITGWLYTSTRFAAAKARRGEQRRRAREQEVYAMQTTAMDGVGDLAAKADWEQLRPVIDEALLALDERDREAVLLRFFEGRPLAEVGAKLSVSEDTARVRVARALDKLERLLARRGITSTAAALGLALGGQAGAAVPAGLAAVVTSGAMAGVLMISGATLFELMITSKITLGAVTAAACIAAGVAVFEANALSESKFALADAQRDAAGFRAKMRDLEVRLDAQSKRAAAAEDDNAKLLAAVRSVQAAQAVAATVPITHDVVTARYKRAQELAKAGQAEEALKEYLWCFDEGMSRVAAYGGVRFSFLLGQITKLGEQYPAALSALRERRDAAERRMAASATDHEATSTFGSINRVLNEKNRTLTAFDQLQSDDPRRKRLGSEVFDELTKRKSYRDAVEARPYAMMSSSFERSARDMPGIAGMPNADKIREANRLSVVSSALKNIEVLAGAGELDDARKLAGQVLAFDGSEATRALLQKHLERAGKPDLLKDGGK